MPQKLIEFIDKDVLVREGEETCVMVTQLSDALADPYRKVIRRTDIEIEIDYPLGIVVKVPAHCKGGFTRLQLFRAIVSAYRKIYRSTKKYGVWGHSIDDLWLEGAQLRGDTLKLSIGS